MTEPKNIEPDFLTLDQLSGRLQFPKSWIYDRTRRGASDPLPAFRFGKHLRFKTNEIEKWLEGHRKG